MPWLRVDRVARTSEPRWAGFCGLWQRVPGNGTGSSLEKSVLALFRGGESICAVVLVVPSTCYVCNAREVDPGRPVDVFAAMIVGWRVVTQRFALHTTCGRF